ncbi:hypothetical protein N8I77_003174 [Diaporthe amygdali]|uniref:Uncharacterized protein n=1 Tax=Phomopsis amygdali TaxID=1214568 RepID=A0AAD9W4N1_PHOAM|nr:hypothetical protein N8I77_003174 [Diaporthe amygdali]
MAEVNWPRTKQFLKSQLLTHLPTPAKRFTGQTIIITGSNTGMGLEAARHLVRLDAARIILAVRNPDKGSAAAASIRASFPDRKSLESVVQVWTLDLASYASVQAFAARAAAELDRLDVVVCNAGMYVYKSGFSVAEKDEVTITVNVVSTFLLGLLLLPKLRETSVRHDKEVVLTFTGSFVHYMTDFPERNRESIFQELADEKKARMPDRYNVSKLMELLIFRELADQITKSSKPGRITTSIINPGFVKTEIMRDGTWLFRIYYVCLAALMSRTPEEGGRILVNAAEGGKETHGQYLDDCQVGTPSAFVRGSEGQKIGKQLWTELAAKLEIIQPGVMDNV